MSEYRFELEKGGLKYTCPQCGKARLVRYVDTVTGEQVADHAGRCDREDSCGYHLRPSEYFQVTGKKPFRVTMPTYRPKQPTPEPSFIDAAVMRASLARYEQNNFCRWLCGVLGEERAFELTALYQIGTSKHWAGSSVFWQIDTANRVRGGKVMLYDVETGRRVKEPFPHVNWVHRVMKIEPYHLRQCFFGEHLLTLDTVKPVAVVESEKTALVASGFIPEFIWMATAGKQNLNKEKLKSLQGRRVKLFPDLGAFERWQSLSRGVAGVTVSDVLERRATDADKAAGLDLADFLLRENRAEMRV
jgi:predicted RNA-binding Zn-ribbon protein involved in translation (DUF1610 family)